MAKTPTEILADAKALYDHNAFGKLQQDDFFRDMKAAIEAGPPPDSGVDPTVAKAPPPVKRTLSSTVKAKQG